MLIMASVNVEFIFPFFSHLNTRLWTKVDRCTVRKAVIPVHATFGLETNNFYNQPVQYLFETETDGIKFMKIELKSPHSFLRTRIDKMTSGHYKIGLYEVCYINC